MAGADNAKRLTCLREAFDRWKKLLQQLERGKVEAGMFEKFYQSKMETPFKTSQLGSALFNRKTYPVLAHLGITANPAKAAKDLLPWTLENIHLEISASPIAQILLAYIWKRGEWLRVSHLLRGIDASQTAPTNTMNESVDPQCGDKAPAVMEQFGRHLAKPDHEPIFDQHTSRQLWVLRQIRMGGTTLHFGDCIDKIPASSALTRDADRKDYVEWWALNIRKWIKRYLPKKHWKSELLWVDRIMFSLGKASSILQRSARKSGASTLPAAIAALAKSNPSRQTKIQKVRQVMQQHANFDRRTILPLLITEARLTEKGAATYYQLVKGKTKKRRQRQAGK